MKNSQYSNGFKTIAIMLQMVFLMVVIVVLTLLVNLFGRSMLSFRDVGNDSFFDSFYYTEVVSGEAKDLVSYLKMRQSGKTDGSEDGMFKQLKLKYDNEETNFYYCLFRDGETITNMEGAADFEEALSCAKDLGSYLSYDDSAISFQGNIHHINQSFHLTILRLFQGKWQGGSFVLAVDTSLHCEDVISEAAKMYETFFPLVEFFVFAVVMAFIGFLLSMIYITLATGRNASDDKIKLYRLDYLPTELLFLIFLGFVTGLIAFCAKLSGREWELSSSLILTGTLVFVSDAAFLAIYLSFVRKIKANLFMSCSLCAYIVRTVKEGMRRQKPLRRALIQFVIYTFLGLFFAWEAFSYRSIWAMAGLSAVFVYIAVHFLEQAIQRKRILEGIQEISTGNLNFKFESEKFSGDYRTLAEKINGIGEGLSNAVEKNVKNERLKTELVTNVSHDIKTPLTSIINYIDLIKLEGVENGNIKNYVNILEKKSQRLKQLTEDLIEVSQITTGNITLDMQPINMVELICQTGGEFNEIFEEMGLTIITRFPKEPVMILADGSRTWRVVQNLYNNVAKYAMKDTRVYVDLKENNGMAEFSIKDISAQEIRKMPQDLSERFVRGDESRGTEGSGLGLSIARNLTNLMGGTFDIQLDGDLFTVCIRFPTIDS